MSTVPFLGVAVGCILPYTHASDSAARQLGRPGDVGRRCLSRRRWAFWLAAARPAPLCCKVPKAHFGRPTPLFFRVPKAKCQATSGTLAGCGSPLFGVEIDGGWQPSNAPPAAFGPLLHRSLAWQSRCTCCKVPKAHFGWLRLGLHLFSLPNGRHELVYL